MVCQGKMDTVDQAKASLLHRLLAYPFRPVQVFNSLEFILRVKLKIIGRLGMAECSLEFLNFEGANLEEVTKVIHEFPDMEQPLEALPLD